MMDIKRESEEVRNSIAWAGGKREREEERQTDNLDPRIFALLRLRSMKKKEKANRVIEFQSSSVESNNNREEMWHV